MLGGLSGRVGTGVKWRIKRIDLDLNLCLRPAFPPNYLASMANGHIGHSSKAKYGRKSIPHNLAMHSLTLTGLHQVVIKPKESDNCLDDHSGLVMATKAALPGTVIANWPQLLQNPLLQKSVDWSRDRRSRVVELVVMMERSSSQQRFPQTVSESITPISWKGLCVAE